MARSSVHRDEVTRVIVSFPDYPGWREKKIRTNVME